MTSSIDDQLLAAFTFENVIIAFRNYKYAKWDHFSDWNSPEINIPVGADGTTFAGFEKQLYTRNARNICRRIEERSYSFYALREVKKEKEPGTKKYRTLSIASIRDVIVQNIIYSHVLYQPLETLFRTLDKPFPKSFSYRRGRSAGQAAKTIAKYIEDGFTHILDGDITKYFDSIPHNLLLKKFTEVIGVENIRTIELVERFIKSKKVPLSSYNNYRYKDGKRVGYKIFHKIKPKGIKRIEGIPQGGVLSAILANLYLHDFDVWVVNDLGNPVRLEICPICR